MQGVGAWALPWAAWALRQRGPADRVSRCPARHASHCSRPLRRAPPPPPQALATFGSDVGIAFSGAEDVALIEYAHLTGRPYRVFSLDTGRLNPETYRLFDKARGAGRGAGLPLRLLGSILATQLQPLCCGRARHRASTPHPHTLAAAPPPSIPSPPSLRSPQVEKHYGIKIEYTFPDAQEVMDLVREKGLFSFYEDGHGECCRIRKVSRVHGRGGGGGRAGACAGGGGRVRGGGCV